MLINVSVDFSTRKEELSKLSKNKTLKVFLVDYWIILSYLSVRINASNFIAEPKKNY